LWEICKLQSIWPTFCLAGSIHHDRRLAAATSAEMDGFVRGSVVTHVPGRAAPGRDGQHGKAKRDHHQTHEFESKRVHEKFPPMADSLVGVALSVP
jgi:hypothetical protein